MVLIALLLAALVCLILGLVLASGPWLIGSLVASVVAGIVLWRQREQVSSRAGSTGGSTGKPGQPAATTRQTSLVTGTAFAGKVSAAPAPVVADVSVWVVDGEPEYHAESCAKIESADSEPVPLAQAIEDGFRECSTCTPVPGLITQVWVIDGRPDYHRKDCSRVSRGAAEEIPRAQAVQDGFSACDQCNPDTVETDEPATDKSASDEAATDKPATDEPDAAPAAEPAAVALDKAQPAATEPEAAAPSAEPDAEPSRVWVVDGRPRYHLQACMIIKDQDAEPIPLSQATEDGFMPCSMCEPNVTRV
jgi:hypothetical protein